MKAQVMKSYRAKKPAQGQASQDQPAKAATTWHEVKQQAVQAAAREVPPEADARQTLGFMPMKLKGAGIRWRGL